MCCAIGVTAWPPPVHARNAPRVGIGFDSRGSSGRNSTRPFFMTIARFANSSARRRDSSTKHESETVFA